MRFVAAAFRAARADVAECFARRERRGGAAGGFVAGSASPSGEAPLGAAVRAAFPQRTFGCYRFTDAPSVASPTASRLRASRQGQPGSGRALGVMFPQRTSVHATPLERCSKVVNPAGTAVRGGSVAHGARPRAAMLHAETASTEADPQGPSPLPKRPSAQLLRLASGVPAAGPLPEAYTSPRPRRECQLHPFTALMLCSGYRSPAATPLGATSSIAARSSGVSSTSSARRFSSR